MKSLTRSLLVTCMCLATVTGFSQMEKVTGGLPVVGSVTEEGKRCQDATVTLYEGNDVINSFKTPRNGRFQLLLHTGKYYTLEVIKEGYVQKRISIDTEMGNRRISVPVYECDLDIIPTSLFKDMDIGDLDFPMAIVTFDPKTREFTHSELYTSSMRTTYEELLKEAYSRNGVAMNR